MVVVVVLQVLLDMPRRVWGKVDLDVVEYVFQVDVLVYLTALDHMAEVMAAVAAGDQVNLLVMRHQVLEVGAALLELYGAKEHLFHTGLLEEYGTVTYATNLKDNHEKIYSNKR